MNSIPSHLVWFAWGPDPMETEGYVKVDGLWRCAATHRGSAELRCQAPDRRRAHDLLAFSAWNDAF